MGTVCGCSVRVCGYSVRVCGYSVRVCGCTHWSLVVVEAFGSLEHVRVNLVVVEAIEGPVPGGVTGRQHYIATS